MEKIDELTTICRARIRQLQYGADSFSANFYLDVALDFEKLLNEYDKLKDKKF